jgi:DHA3 family macrolide efflux protein-like MFS transporter
VAALTFGLASIGLGLSPTLWVFVGLTFAVGVVVPFFSTTSTTLVQEQVEAEYVGRVFGVMSIVMAVAMPLGMSIFGPLADVYSVQSVLVASGILAIGVTLVAGRRAPVVLAPPGVGNDSGAPATPGDLADSGVGAPAPHAGIEREERRS